MILRPVSKIEFLRVFPKVYRGTHINHPQIEILRGKTVEIAAAAIAYADGERIGNLPLKANLIPHALKVWC
jgi:diacylglycerol kinase (ATP)